MHEPITKAQLRKLLGVDTDAEVAEFFQISQSAVSQWGGDEDSIPRGRRLDLIEKRPDLMPQLLGHQEQAVTGAR